MDKSEVEYLDDIIVGQGITLEQGDCGTYLIVHDDGRDILVQTDWDYPGLAVTFGWAMSPNPDDEDEDSEDDDLDEDEGADEDKDDCWDDEEGEEQPCGHNSTDGTVDCPNCRKTASEFIGEAAAFLDENIGKRVEDPGYFD